MSPGWPVAPAAVALDVLDDRERVLADRLLADDPLFRAEVERLRATAGALARLDRDAWRPPAPPPLPDEPAPVPPGAVAVRRPRRRFALATAVALTLALALLVAGDRRDHGATTLALRPLAGVPGRATLTITGAQAELRGTGMPASGTHDYYEAWLGDARGRMVSMGTFRVGRDGRVDARMAVAVDLRRYRLLDVSLERDDGNPAHSATSVMRAIL
jgi:hypothetical protein